MPDGILDDGLCIDLDKAAYIIAIGVRIFTNVFRYDKACGNDDIAHQGLVV